MKLAWWIVLFLVVDAVVVYFVVRHAMRKNGGLALAGFKQIATFAKDMNDEIGRHLQANYSGDPAHLEQAMRGMLNVVRSRAAERGLTMDDALLKKLIETSAIQHRIAKAQEIRSALDRAA